MKAIIVKNFGSSENMTWSETAVPQIGSDQVLIKVKTTSVNYADIKARVGTKEKGNLPFIPGLEAAGIVEKVGPDVLNILEGQRVLAFPHDGSYAEYMRADAQLTFPIPDSMTFETAGSCGIVSFLSYHLLANLAKMIKGETVLIHSAAGGVGTTAIQTALALGAGMVIGTVGNEQKMQIAKDAGAHYVVNYEKEDISRLVNELTNGKGADIVLDSVGGKLTDQSFDCLAKYGKLVVFGNSSGEYGTIPAGKLHSSCRSVLGFSLGTTRKERPEVLQKMALHVFQLLEAGQLKINIGKKFRLEEAAAAHDWVESRKSTGKVLLMVNE
ncbi:NADPH:quinone oxidoreductase family protein [Fictibacillus enclensis]|uniref:quinone oxidoreductase family protein n=1 Tax=Fictibacillus enclensis TaxID=1017270 RepID=UPI0025A168FA|nr:NADPH:quinone oxidoreductase family protein [Fictibacillus enclensis]MDM5200775.1 NADPH:quinone oxidoreductase family protein [Fictibacillus enclensis]